MAEFSCNDPVVTEPGEKLDLPEIKMPCGSRWWVSCRWLENGREEHGYWELTNDSMEEAYQVWRKENWEQLFDPFKVKILSLHITQMV